MNNHAINNNSSLADFITYLLEASGLKEKIAEIVKDAVAANLPSPKKQQDNTEDSAYYTRSELCQLAHITETTLWRLEREGVIKKIKFGRKNLYSRLDVDALLGSGGFHFPPKSENPKKAGRKAKKK